jgi:hypothetical protein
MSEREKGEETVWKRENKQKRGREKPLTISLCFLSFQFNFVGKLLGPKGNSLKRLQEETMCKMAVLGKGSMRDRKKVCPIVDLTKLLWQTFDLFTCFSFFFFAQEEELRLSGDPRYAHLSEDLHVEISTFSAPAEAHARIAYALAEVRRFLVPVSLVAGKWENRFAC